MSGNVEPQPRTGQSIVVSRAIATMMSATVGSEVRAFAINPNPTNASAGATRCRSFRCLLAADRRRWIDCFDVCTSGCGAITIRRVRKLLIFGDVETDGVATSCAPPKSPPIRCCAGFTSSTRSTNADLARGLWHRDSGARWLAPLAIFLCLFGLILILAATVEALAPFIYAIF